MIVALPEQLFYNTGISTYIWIVTNHKAPERAGHVPPPLTLFLQRADLESAHATIAQFRGLATRVKVELFSTWAELGEKLTALKNALAIAPLVEEPYPFFELVDPIAGGMPVLFGSLELGEDLLAARLAKLRLLPLAPLLLIALPGCRPLQRTEVGTVRMHLIDAPAALEAVRIVVTEVAIHASGGFTSENAENGSGSTAGFDRTSWEVLTAVPATYDLLTLRGGASAALAEGIVPAGAYTQIRLTIGEGSNVVVDGVTYPLVVPSGAQSGFKIVHAFTVPRQGAVDVTLDFDAEKSVFETANGSWYLKPTITVTSTSVPATTRVGR